MSLIRDLNDVYDHIKADDHNKWDTVVPRKSLLMQEGRLLVPQSYHGVSFTHELKPSAWAVSQFCQKLSIPTAYFKRCPLALQAEQFNYWIARETLKQAFKPPFKPRKTSQHPSEDSSEDSFVAQSDHESNHELINEFNHEFGDGMVDEIVDEFDEEEKGIESSSSMGVEFKKAEVDESESERWMLRAKDTTLRGVVSARYYRFDNTDLLRAIGPFLEAHFQVNWFALTEEALHLRLIDPRLGKEVLPNDRLLVGVHFSNSEVGKRAITVDALVYRLVCSNGLIKLIKGKSLLSQRHLYLSKPRFEQALQRAFQNALTASAAFLDQLEWATTEPIGDVEKTLERLARQWNLSLKTQEFIKLALLSEPLRQQEMLYGLTNAFTSAAQRLPADERYTLETLAGQLIEHRWHHPQSPLALPQPLSHEVALR